MQKALIDAYRWNRQQAPRATATVCLARAREDVERGTRRYPHSGKVYAGQWQALDSMPRHASLSDRAYYCDAWPDGWRNLGNVGEIHVDGGHGRRGIIDHTGWYTEDDGDTGTLAGYVLQLPARHGKPLYVPGTAHSDQDGVTLYPLDSYDDIAECARAADQYAEHAAERERDYQRAWRAGNDAADLNRESVELRLEIIQVCRDLRIARSALRVRSPSDTWLWREAASIDRLCGIARNKVQSLLADLYKARERRDALRDDYGRDDAFNEGYGQ